jgi:hypothetical protein
VGGLYGDWDWSIFIRTGRFDGIELVLHGDDKTISTKTAQTLVS